MARRQHGVLTRQDLEGLGFSRKAIEHRVASGRLRLLTRGIYAVGRLELSREGRWMAAVRVGGQGAALSHSSAAALWEIGVERAGGVDISIRRRCRVERTGIRARSRPSLPERDIVMHRGIPVTSPVRTLIDRATELGAPSLERMVNEADKHDLVDPETLRAELDAYAGEPGVKPLRTLLDKATFRLSDTDLEVLFRPIADEADLPVPMTKEIVNGFEVDFFWPALGLVVETDGLRYHRTPSAQAKDLRRDQTHTVSGLTTLRFTHYEVRYEPDHVRRVLELTARRLGTASET